MSILVFGSKGQLGRCFNDHLSGSIYNPVFFSKDELNIIDFKEVQKTINLLKPNIVINASAYTDVDGAEDNKDLANLVNHLAVKNLAEICKKTNSFLVHFSTDYVFSSRTIDPIHECFETNPINIYGQTKLDGEFAIKESGCKHIILRTSWVYSEYGKNFLKTVLKLSGTKNKLKIINDQYGCPTYARDIAKTIIQIIPMTQNKSFKSGIYHYCGDKVLSWFEFASIIFKEAYKYDPNFIEIIPIKSSSYNSQAKRPSFSILNCTKIKKEFNCATSNTNNGIAISLKSIYESK